MSKYLLRIWLHEKSGEKDIPATDYTKLHSELDKVGFKRTVSDGSTEYGLPPAEYRRSTTSELKAATVRDEAMAAIEKAKLGRRYATFVVRYDAAAWSGLKEA